MIVQTVIIGGNNVHLATIIKRASWIIMIILLAGCFQGEQTLEEMDMPQIDYSEQESAAEPAQGEEDEPEEEPEASSVFRELFLLDANGMVAPQSIEMPLLPSYEVATQALEYLVRGGPITPSLPNGFQAVLPEGTEVLGMDLQKDGTLVVDLSEEFKEYAEQEELKILQAMTYTLTQFENVERIKLHIAGEPISEMPVAGTPISQGYSRANGINLLNNDITDFLQSETETIYYPAQYQDQDYYIPVTQYMEKNDEDKIETIVNSLLGGTSLLFTTNIVHVFHPDAGLAEPPTIEDGVVTLHFNEMILEDVDQQIIADEVVETLVRTLTEQPTIEAVQIKVSNMDSLKRENGESYDEPVTKESFSTKDKL